MTDWRSPGLRREHFQRMYSLHLQAKAHPGLVYSWLPAIADAYSLDEDGRAWLAWLNGNTQNPATSLLLLEAAPSWEQWEDAVAFWNARFKDLEWDTDRRHQKSKFGVATAQWVDLYAEDGPTLGWDFAAGQGWEASWKHAFGMPHFGRLSAWSGLEFARILLPNVPIPDAADLMLRDPAGSQSHRNGLATIAGYDAAYWDWSDAKAIVPYLQDLGADLLREARTRNPGNPDVSYLTLESALCTYKSQWKPNRRYPGVYADMAYDRLVKAESRFGPRFEILWEARQRDLPSFLRREDREGRTGAPGLDKAKQNQFRETGVPVNLDLELGDLL